MTSPVNFDPKLDLVLERVVDVSPEVVWSAWTNPEHVKKWFAPAPTTIVECEIDLRPGGVFRFVMRTPEGELFPNLGCYLEVVPGKRLVWTDCLLPGFRPAPKPFFTASVEFERDGDKTRYVARALHGDEAVKKQHEEMGFYEGWGQVLDQLVAFAKNL